MQDLKGDRQDGEICVICMETIKKAKHLPCGHSFCRSCIEEQFTYKETCPTCGQICGIIKGKFSKHRNFTLIINPIYNLHFPKIQESKM